MVSPFCDRSVAGQIVDSIMALFRTDFSGRGELSERQQKVFAHNIRPSVHFTNDPKACSGSIITYMRNHTDVDRFLDALQVN